MTNQFTAWWEIYIESLLPVKSDFCRPSVAQCPNSGLVLEFEIIIYDDVRLERFDGLKTGQQICLFGCDAV